MIETMRLIINTNTIETNKKSNNDSSIINGNDDDDDITYQLLIQSIEKHMEKCKIMILSQVISILILIHDNTTTNTTTTATTTAAISDDSDDHRMSLLVMLRIAITLCNGHDIIPSLMINRTINPTIALTITSNTNTNTISTSNSSNTSDVLISFKVIVLLVSKKWKHSNSITNRIGWRASQIM